MWTQDNTLNGVMNTQTDYDGSEIYETYSPTHLEEEEEPDAFSYMYWWWVSDYVGFN